MTMMFTDGIVIYHKSREQVREKSRGRGLLWKEEFVEGRHNTRMKKKDPSETVCLEGVKFFFLKVLVINRAFRV